MAEIFQPATSVDCVIFGFQEGVLKILLNKFHAFGKWMLPGGFIKKNESIDEAVYSILKTRTGLENVYLHQFHTFGEVNRTDIEENKQVLKAQGFSEAEMHDHWLVQRFISVAYYALVDYSQVNIRTPEGEETRWFNLNEIPPLYSDHNHIVEKALYCIRTQITITPVGYKLLPERFTLTELRLIYETILGKKLDRRNFQRKILSSGLVNRLDAIQKKMGFKPTTLFSFDKENYRRAIENGERLF
jgi:hypothetical protein